MGELQIVLDGAVDVVDTDGVVSVACEQIGSVSRPREGRAEWHLCVLANWREVDA